MIKKIISFVLLITLAIPTNVFANTQTNNETEHYDVVVVGGEPEGVAAAVSAARNGSKVLLLDSRSKLGGLLTIGEMNILDIPKNFNNEYVSQGIFEEFHEMIGNTSTADIDASVEAFNTLVNNEPNITLKLNTNVTSFSSKDGYIKSIRINENGKYSTVTADNFIDATADADFANMIGVSSTYGSEDIGRPNEQMPVTLMMHFTNVDWHEMASYVKETGIATVTSDAAWGFWDFVEDYQESQSNTNLRGLNIGKDLSDDVYINALQIFNVDAYDEKQKADAIEKGKIETQHILEWLRVNLPGFENAQIADYPEELYIRESRHVNTLYTLSIVDVFENRDQWDKIAYGGYPVDIQAPDKTKQNLILVNPDQYAIPFRSLVPQDMKNLLVTSKASGYSSLAAASARVIPTGMAVGEAGGLAASMASQKNIDFHTMSQDVETITELQNKLRANGAYLPETSELSFPYEDAPYYDDMKELYTRGLLHLDYSNDLNENSEVSYQSFYDDMIQILPDDETQDLFIQITNPSDKIITVNNVRNIFTTLYGEYNLSNFNIPEGNANLTVKDFIVIKANLVRYLDSLTIQDDITESDVETEDNSATETQSI